ncbi:MAG: acyl-CoA dehydrogenase family protein [Flavobacteriaceae bacterium]|nr:acyl-CoA dehydrogenase family protein [Flavobacteriaceae bacterium]
MSLILTEEQQLLKSSANDLLNNKSPISALRELRDNNYSTFNKSVYQEMVDMGFTALTIPDKYNGLNFGYVGLGQVLEETGKTLTMSPLISSILFSATILRFSNNEQLKSKFLPLLMNGSHTMSFAIEEDFSHSPEKIKFSITESNEFYVLNGVKTFVIDGTTADSLIVVGKSKEEIVFVHVNSNSKGISIKPNLMMDSWTYATIEFKDVEIKKEACIENKKGLDLLNKILNIGYIGISAEMLGIIQESFDITIKYLKEREQFGVKIGTFQALQHRASIMFSEIELCKSIVIKALKGIDQNLENLSILASLSKSKLGSALKMVTNEAVQMHGGIGVTDDADIGFYLKRARVIQKLFGDVNYHLDRYAKLNGY